MTKPIEILHMPSPLARAGGTGGVTPRLELDSAMRKITAAWNASVPRNHVRYINQPRYRDLAALLAKFPADLICDAIRFYGGQTWQRRKNAWQRFDKWIAESNVTIWIEEMLEARDRAAIKTDRARAAESPAAKIAQGIGRRVPDEEDPQAALREAFGKLSTEVRAKYLNRARIDLERIAGSRRSVLTPFMVRMRAITFWQRDDAQKGS